LGGTFEKAERLLVRTKEEFKQKENIDIYTKHRVIKIHPESKEVEVKNLETDEVFRVNYTKLLIATGAKPFLPPCEGHKLNNVFTLRSVNDGIAIKNALLKAKKAVIVGAGSIGLESLEAFIERGVDTTIIEKEDQIIPVLDKDMALQAEKYLREQVQPRYKAKMEIITGDGMNRILGDENNNVRAVETDSGRIIEADVVLVAIGVRPTVDLAKDIGIEIGPTGAIKVNKQMQTNIEDIYAAGDCCEKTHLVTGKPVWFPLGSNANKEGRIAAINMTGGHAEFPGVLGSSVTGVFDYTLSMAGLTEKEAQRAGIKYEVAIIPHRDRAGYMPNVGQIIIKMLAEQDTGRILGVQIIGNGDCDKRTNVAAIAISAGLTVDEFADADLTYAPPYSPAIDPILTAAQVLQNKLSKKAIGISPKQLQKYLEDNIEVCLLDIGGLDQFAHSQCVTIMNEDEVDKKLRIVQDKDKKIVVYCQEGMHSYILSRKLRMAGYKNVEFVDGGLCSCVRKTY